MSFTYKEANTKYCMKYTLHVTKKQVIKPTCTCFSTRSGVLFFVCAFTVASKIYRKTIGTLNNHNSKNRSHLKERYITR